MKIFRMRAGRPERRRPGGRRVPRVEGLEERALLAANLTITGASLVNGSLQPLAAPVLGQQIWLLATWNSTDLTSADQYRVHFSVDGVTLQSAPITGQAGQNLPYGWYILGWYATPGAHSVVVTVDGDNAVAESDESDNTRSFTITTEMPDSLPEKLSQPLGGVPFRDWSIVNYEDVNPLGGLMSDYLGGPFVYDGHNGHDLTLPNFAGMDSGTPIFAAAGGVVSGVVDGNFDRETGPNGHQGNFVEIDHGNGWSTLYYHMMSGGIAVSVGDVVRTGQLLGMTGSSGNSTDAHLHFGLYYQGALVEPEFAPATYWADPLPYQGDVASTVLDAGVSNGSVWDDFKERPVSVTTFPTSRNWDVWAWFRLAQLKPTDAVQVRWYRPDGTIETFYNYNSGGAYHRYGGYAWILPASRWSSRPGTWQVAMEINGVEVVRRSFDVTTGAGTAEAKVVQGATYVRDGRTTPLDFGQTTVGGATPSLSFTLRNLGGVTLTTAGVELPPGFSLVGGTPGAVGPGGSATFTIQLDSAVAGAQFGEVRVLTNDPDDPVYRFNVSGSVAGASPAGSPSVVLPGPALATSLLAAPRVVDPAATLSDPDSSTFSEVRVELASGPPVGVRLGIRDGGTGAGQIGLSGATVLYEGTPIGTFAGGDGTTPLVVSLNASASLAATQALLRSVTYANDATTDVTTPRSLRFVVTDDSGLVSNLEITKAISSGRNAAPTPAGPSGPFAVLEGADLVLAATSGTDADGNDLTYSWDLDGDGVFGDATGLAPVVSWMQLVGLGLGDGPLTVSGVVLRTSDGINPPVDSPPTSLTILNLPPAVSAGPDATITRGSPFTRTIAFADPGLDTWTATVDYGDGGGEQAVDIGADQTIELSHTDLAAPGIYTVIVRVNDGTDVGTATFSVAVVAPAAVAAVQVNDGSAQRSMVTQLTVWFSQPVASIDPGAFAVVADSGPSPTTTATLSADGLSVVLTFSGDGIVAGSLADGFYRLAIDASLIHDANGAQLDGDGDGLAGGTYAGSDVHRLYGDTDGDADVDNLDFLRFRGAVNKSSGQVGYVAYLDEDGDGTIDSDDLSAFLLRRGTRLTR